MEDGEVMSGTDLWLYTQWPRAMWERGLLRLEEMIEDGRVTFDPPPRTPVEKLCGPPVRLRQEESWHLPFS